MEQLDDRKVQGGLDLAHRLTWNLADVRGRMRCGGAGGVVPVRGAKSWLLVMSGAPDGAGSTTVVAGRGGLRCPECSLVIRQVVGSSSIHPLPFIRSPGGDYARAKIASKL